MSAFHRIFAIVVFLATLVVDAHQNEEFVEANGEEFGLQDIVVELPKLENKVEGDFAEESAEGSKNEAKSGVEAEEKEAAKNPQPAESAQESQESQESEQEVEESPEPAKPEVRRVYGWKEWVTIEDKQERMRAKLDSGARTSSIHAEDVEEFERDGKRWIRFQTLSPGKEGDRKLEIVAPVQRIARVKNTNGTMERRFVVDLNFVIGTRKLREEFTLNDRRGLTCPVLLGRNALRLLGYVDCDRVDLVVRKIEQ